MKKIDFETHFATQGWVDALYNNPGNPKFAHDPVSKNRRLYYFPEGGEPFGDVLLDKLLNMGEPRVKAMDEAGVDIAVVSLTAPGVERFETAQAIHLAQEANNILAEAIDKYPDRYQGLRRPACARCGRGRQGVGARGQRTRDDRLEDALQLRRYLFG